MIWFYLPGRLQVMCNAFKVFSSITQTTLDLLPNSIVYCVLLVEGETLCPDKLQLETDLVFLVRVSTHWIWLCFERAEAFAAQSRKHLNNLWKQLRFHTCLVKLYKSTNISGMLTVKVTLQFPQQTDYKHFCCLFMLKKL